MNIKIKDKNGITLKTKGKYVTEDIAVGIDESLLGGEGATIIKGGTVIPNTGTLQEVYFNTALSVEEVVSVLSTLTYDPNMDNMYPIAYGVNESANFGSFLVAGCLDGFYIIMDIYLGAVIFSTAINEDMGVNFVGWNTSLFDGTSEFGNAFSGNKVTLPYELTLMESAEGVTIGFENEQLKDVVSLTDFNYSIELSGEYDGSTLVVEDISPIEVNAPIPRSGTLSSINVNSNLSIEETIAIIDNLKMAEADLDVFVMGVHWVYSTTTDYNGLTGGTNPTGRLLEIVKNIFTDSTQNRYVIKEYNDSTVTTLFNYNWDTSLANGWLITDKKIIFDEPLTLVSLMQNNNGESLDVGTDNKNLTDIFYIKKEEPFSINIEKLIKDKKIPLNIKFKYVLPKVIKSGSWQGTAVPNSGTLSEVYFNTALSVNEVVSLLEQLTFEKLSPSEDTLYNFILSDITQSGGSIAYMVSKDPNNNAYKIFNYMNSKEFFSSDNGWNLESFTDTNRISFNEPINVATSFMGAYAVGAENDKISSLFSITPFVQASGEATTLEGEYDGSTLVIEDISKGYAEDGKLAFPNTGYVEHIYVNTELTQSEVKDTLGKITGWLDTSENQDGSSFVYAVLYNSVLALFIMKMGSDYMMQALLTEVGLEGIIYDDTQGGWLSDGIEFVETYLEKWEVGEVFSNVEGTPVGTDNDKLVDLFYTLPKANTINVKSLINNKKIPLEIEVKGNDENGDTLKNLLDYTKSCFHMFYENKTITDLTGMLPYDSTSNVTTMSNMFFGCNKLTTIPLLNTSNVTNMTSMFSNCSALTTIPQLDTSKVTIMNSMFASCRLLTKIDITHYNLSSTSNASAWCSSCYSLKAVIIRSFGTSYVLNSNSFTYCYHILGTVDHNSIYNPEGLKDGYIYVPRNMIETLSSATNWSTHATQFRALEDYTKDGTTTGEFDDEKAGLV